MITLFKVRKPNYVSVGIEEAFESGVITEGPVVKEFEDALKEEFFDETTPLCTVNSGTSALTLSLRLLDLEEGAKVVTTPMTCSATNIAILNAGQFQYSQTSIQTQVSSTSLTWRSWWKSTSLGPSCAWTGRHALRSVGAARTWCAGGGGCGARSRS